MTLEKHICDIKFIQFLSLQLATFVS